MRRNFHIRKITNTLKDIDDCQNALINKPHLDTEMLAYPSTSILVAEDGQDKIFAPIQTCYVIDTLGYKSGTPNSALAKAMKEIVTVLVWEARQNGIGEILFLGTDEGTNSLALNNSFEMLPYRVYRLRSSDPNRASKGEGSHNGISENND